LTSIIRQIHTDFRGVYGARRMHAELTLGRGIAVGREAVEMLMRRAGLQGVSGRRSYRHVPNTPTASDLVDRKFERAARDQLWVTDITDACSGPCRSPIPAQADHRIADRLRPEWVIDSAGIRTSVLMGISAGMRALTT